MNGIQQTTCGEQNATGRTIFFFFRTLLSSFWTSRGHRCRSFSTPVLAFIFIAHRVQQSRCSSTFHRELLTYALAFSASQFVRKKKSPRIYTRLHSGEFELTKQTYVCHAREKPDTPPGRPALCVRVLYPLFTAASCYFCRSTYVTCYCPLRLAPLFSIRAAFHATRAPFRFLAVPKKLEFEL